MGLVKSRNKHMEKVTFSSESIGRHYGAGRMVPQETPEHLVGRLCTLIETMGLKDTQEKATKDLIKQEVYKMFSQDGSAWWLEDTLYAVIYNCLVAKQESARKENLPPGLDGEYVLTFTPKNG